MRYNNDGYYDNAVNEHRSMRGAMAMEAVHGKGWTDESDAFFRLVLDLSALARKNGVNLCALADMADRRISATEQGVK